MVMPKHAMVDVPYIFSGITPRCHVTSLQTILEYYGVSYSPSYLMNLAGFNYGFRYSRKGKVAFPFPNPPLGPWEFLAYAADKIGCRTELIKDRPWADTWDLMKTCLDRGVPVLIARLNMKNLWKVAVPIPHLVVLCGYDEQKGVVMIHDSALGDMGEGVQYLRTSQLPEKSGRYAEFSIEDFKEAFDLTGTPFQDFGKNGFVILKPPAKRQSVDWREVMERNSRLTLGQVEEVIGKKIEGDYCWGPEGIVEFGNDVEQAFGLFDRPEELLEVLTGFYMLTFELGRSYKSDAHAFVAGLAAADGNHKLEQASCQLRSTALQYEQGLAHLDLLFNNPSVPLKDLKGRLAKIARWLRGASESEKRAGELMSQGAKTLKTVQP
ncbi:MAG: BtrH N-terminal domain-containing protein [Deltaproteobacteria bacterium]